MLSRNCGVAAALLLSAVSIDTQAVASIVVGNLDKTPAGSIHIFDTEPDENRQVGTKFTTGAGGPWLINYVTLALTEILSPDRVPDPLVFEIRSDAGTEPGATIFGSFTSISNITVVGNYDFSPLAPTILADSTSYWLVGIATADNGDGGDDSDAVDYEWTLTNELLNDPAPAWSIQNQTVYTDDNGTNWDNAEAAAATMFAIDATPLGDPGPVPEPATLVVWWLLGLTVSGAAWRRTRS
jgi:hypothetical protein